MEMPAGLIDKGESASVAGLRELKEETGYTGSKVTMISPIVVGGKLLYVVQYYYRGQTPHSLSFLLLDVWFTVDPGMTNANMQMVMIEVGLRTTKLKPQLSPYGNVNQIILNFSFHYCISVNLQI